MRASLPAHVEADLRPRAVLRAIVRAFFASTPDAVALVAPFGRAGLPDGVLGHVAGRAAVAVVSRERAAEIASARSRAAAAQLGADPGAGARWILYLDAGQRCAVVPYRLPQRTRGGASRPLSVDPTPCASCGTVAAPLRVRADGSGYCGACGETWEQAAPRSAS